MATLNQAIVDLEADVDGWRDRAYTAEDELTAVYKGLRRLSTWLKTPGRGPVVFRSEVEDHLSGILDP